MAIPRIKGQDISGALKFIDENGVPFRNQSTKYELVTEDGKRYPPKYVIAVAEHIAHGTEVSTEKYNAVEAKNFFEAKGFNIETKPEKFVMRITADLVESTDERFSMDNLWAGDNYMPLDVFLEKSNGEIIRRNRKKNENRISRKTMPLIAFQVFEKELSGLSVEEREQFPTCQYSSSSDVIRGIFLSNEEYEKHHTTVGRVDYTYDNGRHLIIFCWNIFSTLMFVQECLKRFGEKGDAFVLTYREKEARDEDTTEIETFDQEEQSQKAKGYMNPFSAMLIESKNLVFHGAPGTGKSYLAREIAADIVSDGFYDKYEKLSEDQKKQVEFVQFHPSYDYSDFVEGLRPKKNDDDTIGFELKDGIFKKFVDRARKNYEDSLKSKDTIEKEMSAQEAIDSFFSNIELGVDTFKTINGNEFTITGVDDKHISIYIPKNAQANKLTLSMDEIRRMLESGRDFEQIKDVTTFFGKTFATQGYSYDFAIFKRIKSKKYAVSRSNVKQEELKKYIFIIDEINRGEISKIFGELFFAIEPGYRGKAGEISTQYSNLHVNPDEKFYIPENVYIIGTMNDIDRSVDSFDFAMRRRFRFVELKVDDRLEMLTELKNEEQEEEAIRRMTALNKAIADTPDLNENYQIGASYFLKLKTLDFDQLWTDYLQPLLQEYVRGMYNERELMNQFAKAYGYHKSIDGGVDENTQDQG